MNTSFFDRIEYPPPGHYVVAVSGGVDSVALLHILAHLQTSRGWRLKVAHFNHGIRQDSAIDQTLVRDIAAVYSLPFYTANGNLGAASEEVARKARYAFLQKVVDEVGAQGVITAHHAGDVGETTIFNSLRGSGRQGLTSMRSRQTLLRPLLRVEKRELMEYAQARRLPWREDSTNTDTTLSRNFIRRELMPLAGDEFEQELLKRTNRLARLNALLDRKLRNLMHLSEAGAIRKVTVHRADIQKLRAREVKELVVAMVRVLEPATELSSKLVESLALALRTGKAGQEHAISGSLLLVVGRGNVAVTEIERSIQILQAQELVPEGSVRFGVHQVSYGTACINESHPHFVADTLKVRRVLPGDRIDPVGMTGTKKLQDLFVDAKIDRNRRMSWPVVARVSDNSVVWVPQLAQSRSFSCTADVAGAYCLLVAEV